MDGEYQAWMGRIWRHGDAPEKVQRVSKTGLNCPQMRSLTYIPRSYAGTCTTDHVLAGWVRVGRLCVKLE